jgi:hypothetical protein
MSRSRRSWTKLALVGIVAAVAGLGVVAAIGRAADDDDTRIAIPPSVATAESIVAAPPSASTSTSRGSDEPVGAVTVFPPRASDMRFREPLAVAEQFVVGYLGFRDPLVGEFRAGDARSGEVSVRPVPDGPELTVLVRELDDGNWWVVGAVAESIVVDEPAPAAVVSPPLALAGRAVGFGGTIDAELWTDGADEPLAMSTLAQDGLGPVDFRTVLDFPVPATRQGALIIRSRRGDDGQVWEAAVVPLEF